MLVHRLISLGVLLVGICALARAVIQLDAFGSVLFAAVAYVGFRNVSIR